MDRTFAAAVLRGCMGSIFDLQKALVGEGLKNNPRYWCPKACLYCFEPGGGKFYKGRLRPEPPLLFLHTIFVRKGIPPVYLLLTNGTPFTYLV